MTETNRKLLAFIDASPTAWHACANFSARLLAEGYTELKETEIWKLRAGGKYFVCRNGSSLIAFRLPEEPFSGFLMMAAHTDSPAFKLRGRPDAPSAGVYTRLSVERYGSMLCAPWLDRPLAVAGRVTVRENGKIVTKLVNIRRDLALIPNLAIHMDRTANDGKKYDIKTDMLPLFGSEKAMGRMEQIAAEAAGVAEEDLISTDLYLYPRTPGVVFGADGEFIAAPRLDDLQCAFGCFEGFLAAEAGKNAPLLCVFDNEEVGSTTKQGANSDFLADALWRICEALGREFYTSVAASFMASADNAHAVHPNHPGPPRDERRHRHQAPRQPEIHHRRRDRGRLCRDLPPGRRAGAALLQPRRPARRHHARQHQHRPRLRGLRGHRPGPARHALLL